MEKIKQIEPDTKIADGHYEKPREAWVDVNRASYRDYFQSSEDSMSISEADIIYRRIYGEIDREDKAVAQAFEEMLNRAFEYACMRFLSRNESNLVNIGDVRKERKKSFVNALKNLCNILKIKGKSSDWIVMIDERVDDPGCKRVGDFACYLVLFRSLNAR